MLAVPVGAANAQADDAVPKGGCMPIGWTASGEVVFPVECKALLEQQRGSPLPAAPTFAPSAAVPPAPATPPASATSAVPSAAPTLSAPETTKPAVVDTTQLDTGQKTRQPRQASRRRREVTRPPAATGSVTQQPKRPPSN